MSLAAISRDALLRDPALLAPLLELNNRSALETSWLDADRLLDLVGTSFLSIHAVDAQAILIAFDQSGEYDSPNFLWFKQRLERFVYIDRVIVDAAARGQGLARALYHYLFTAARDAGHDCAVCEVNSDPPNPASDAFHAAMGFSVMGHASLSNGKTVQYMSCPLA